MAQKTRLFTVPALAAALLATAASGQDDEARRGFVEANLLGIFYHELGHALIDLEEVPIFGQEEDAADVFSILLVDSLFDEDTAHAIAIDAAYGFLGEVYLMEDEGEAVAWWDVHGPDEQRFYNTVCLFYGANPEAREEFAEALGLPEERADYCPEEFDQALAAWGDVLDGLIERFEAGQGEPIVLMPGPLRRLRSPRGFWTPKWPRSMASCAFPCRSPSGWRVAASRMPITIPGQPESRCAPNSRRICTVFTIWLRSSQICDHTPNMCDHMLRQIRRKCPD